MENLNTKNEIANEAPLTVDNITGRPILGHDDSKEEIVNDLSIATLDTLLGSSIVEIEQSLVKDLKVIVISKGGHWYDNIKIEGKNNSKFRVSEMNMNNRELFKLSGLVSTYLEYVDYYNRVAEVMVNTPNVDQINTIHSESVLKSIDTLDIEMKNLKERILEINTFLTDVIKTKIQNKEIVIEEITFKFYLNTFLDYFRIRRKIPTDYKSKADKI